VKFFTGLLDWAKVSRPVEVSGLAPEQAVEVRTMESGKEKLAFVFNHGSEPVEPNVRITLPQGSYTAKDLVTGEAIATRYERGGLILKKRLATSDVWVVRISAK
jgi:hypothetical protein